MIVEQLANNPITTLNGAINDSVTSLTVASAALFPTTGTFTILIDDELMLVTAVSGTTFTVTRGSESTTAASHSNGADVTGILTKRSLEQFRSDLIISDSLASRPSTPTPGTLFLPTEGMYVERYSGSSWQSYGPVHRLTKPVSGDFTWVNQGSTTLNSTNGALNLVLPATGVANASMLVKTAPSLPYYVDFCVLGHVRHSQTYHYGFVWRESSTGKYVSAGYRWQGTNCVHVTQYPANYVTGTSYLTDAEHYYPACGIKFFRVVEDTSNRYFYVSYDAIHWTLLNSHSRTNHITANQIGMVIGTAGTTNIASSMIHWKEGVP